MGFVHTVKGFAKEVRELGAQRYRLKRRPRTTSIYGVTVDVDPAWPRVVQDAVYTGAYEGAEAMVLRETLRPEDHYLEVGASSGVIMTLACSIVGDQNVTAYEANLALTAVARRTAASNGYQPAIVHAVLGATDAEHLFYAGEDPLSGSLASQDGVTPQRVPGKLLSDALNEADATYLMVDIEGGEIELLAVTLPGGVRALCVEVHPDMRGEQAVQDLLRGLMDQGFILDTRLSARQVMFLSRDPI